MDLLRSRATAASGAGASADIHGAGRFLVLARDGVAETNLVWKDTVLVTTGETVDILLEVTEPGTWMAHCHIAEHHEAGMMFGFEVASP